ncbi:hypothetical protein R6V09_02495 [Streptomyces sp. W16]|uniref:hypothetical protein n=1 Tax=Streptomyces sp. W16 TaxID=3076631 RepID=UPI00295B6C05|nr:hypothetical protein [Streptomyces sp. W16]MDV9169009.1 hypothetical protein [Streptomyces sp. W16]
MSSTLIAGERDDVPVDTLITFDQVDALADCAEATDTGLRKYWQGIFPGEIPIETDTTSREAWIANLDAIAALNPSIVVTVGLAGKRVLAGAGDAASVRWDSLHRTEA